MRLLAKTALAVAVLSIIAAAVLACSFTAPCPQDGETAQKTSEEFRQFIGGCSNGGTICTYSHQHIVSMGGKTETHTFSIVECR
jgi:hypothetical protein